MIRHSIEIDGLLSSVFLAFDQGPHACLPRNLSSQFCRVRKKGTDHGPWNHSDAADLDGIGSCQSKTVKDLENLDKPISKSILEICSSARDVSRNGRNLLVFHKAGLQGTNPRIVKNLGF